MKDFKDIKFGLAMVQSAVHVQRRAKVDLDVYREIYRALPGQYKTMINGTSGATGLVTAYLMIVKGLDLTINELITVNRRLNSPESVEGITLVNNVVFTGLTFATAYVDLMRNGLSELHQLLLSNVPELIALVPGFEIPEDLK